jgi:hypothetical protein
MFNLCVVMTGDERMHGNARVLMKPKFLNFSPEKQELL